MIQPQTITVKFVSGDPYRYVMLDHLPMGYYYRIEITSPGAPMWWANVVLPAGDGPFKFNQLVQVDPKFGGTEDQINAPYRTEVLGPSAPTVTVNSHGWTVTTKEED